MNINKHSIIILIGVIILISACSNNKSIYSQDMIKADIATIDSIQIDTKLDNTAIISDQEAIYRIVNSLSDLSIEQLANEEQTTIFRDNERYYTITILQDEKIVGMVIVLSSNDILFADTDTLNNDRTESYIHRKLSDERLIELLSVIEI